MNLATPREPFLHALQFSASVCPSRTTRPILADVVVDVDDDQVEITATDGDISVRQRYRAEGVSGDGQAALPASTLLSAVRSMDSETLQIAPKDATHELTGGSAYFRLNSDDPDLFPSVPTLSAEQGIEVPYGELVALSHRTMFAAAKEMGRYAFNGVLFEADAEGLSLVGTDGRRLALARRVGPTGLDERVAVVVPLKGLMQLQRVGAADNTPVRIEVRETIAAFLLPETEVIAQLVEGEFPDYRAVLPQDKDLPGCVTVDREALVSAVQRASITAGDEGPVVGFQLESGRLRLVSRHEGLGESRSELEMDYGGEPLEIRFNPSFLLEYLKTIAAGEVTFRFKDRSSAGRFGSGEDSLYVIMPITS